MWGPKRRTKSVLNRATCSWESLRKTAWRAATRAPSSSLCVRGGRRRTPPTLIWVTPPSIACCVSSTELLGADWGRSELLGDATVNIGKLSGGVAANVIAPEAEAHVYVRVVGRASEAKSKLEQLLGGDSQLSYEIIAQNDAVFCEVLPGFPAEPVAFGTDIPSLTRLGKPLLLGPGSIHDAHTDHEKVGKDELTRAVELYCRIGRSLLEKTE